MQPHPAWLQRRPLLPRALVLAGAVAGRPRPLPASHRTPQCHRKRDQRMKKIPTLYRRNPEDMRRLLPKVHPDCGWVLAGEGEATAKIDGTGTMLDDAGRWWARREAKRGKTPPLNFVAVEHDSATGKTVGWEPIEQSSSAKIHQAVRDAPEDTFAGNYYAPGTYELVGPKINGNPHGLDRHLLTRHGAIKLQGVPTGFDALRDFLLDW